MLYRKKAFTLIELLVVIAIIGILSTIMIVAYTNAQAKARDNKRKADISAISSAIEMYHADHKEYPMVTGSTFTCGATQCYRVRSVNYGTGSQKRWSLDFDSLIKDYISTPLTIDPTNSDDGVNNTTWHASSDEYGYTYLASKFSYVLAARLEVANDGNGDYFLGKTLKDANGNAINLLPTESLTWFSSMYPIPSYKNIFFIGSNMTDVTP